ncbi:uncharacterized protein N7484_002753 [Penicillium longicatenatum]|uniref:uncharacterized protein n=1 Tax=Penicillium longicatenatum TaxID=1561947 RepID=UPI002548A221|nr:uncharacterized protein N7484_002753 [Penicillium longicatenatum]KAJ5649030.1 hypothetical protein N7484_002753 [Penicillium longicatenatum]
MTECCPPYPLPLYLRQLRFTRSLCHIPPTNGNPSTSPPFHQWRHKPHRNAGSGAAVMGKKTQSVNWWRKSLPLL